MEHTYRPQLSRETRLLLTAAALALAVLWLLARLRFPDSPAAPNPVAPLLTQLTPRTAFEDLAAVIANTHGSLAPRLEGFDKSLALALGDGRAVAWLAAPVPSDGAGLIAFETWSGLAVVRSGVSEPPPVWMPADLSRPRYLIAAERAGGQLALRPVYVGALQPSASPVVDDLVWAIPSTTDVAPGTFLFTVDEQLAGMVLRDGNGLAIVPGSALPVLADRVVRDISAPPAELGIHVQAIAGRVADAAGTSDGVIVTHVDRRPGVVPSVVPGDVIVAVDGRTVPNVEYWTAFTARVRAGATVTMRVRRGDDALDLAVAARAAHARPSPSLGLGLRVEDPDGTEVVRVDHGSAGEAAGLRTGDVVTSIDGIARPKPADVRRAFAEGEPGRPLLVAVTRGSAHWVTTLEK